MAPTLPCRILGRRPQTRALLLAPLILLAPETIASEATVRLELGAKETAVNEPVIAELVVENYEQVGEPRVPRGDRYTVRALGGPTRNDSLTIVNGRRTMTRSLRYTFEITPTETGVLIIPPFSINVDGRERETQPARLNVRKAEAQELLLAEITCNRTRLYVGQNVTYTLLLWVKPAVAGRRELNANEMYTLLDGRRQGFGPFPAVRQYNEREREFPDGTRGRYIVYETALATVADRPGPPDFGDLLIAMDYPTSFSRGIFGDLEPREVRRLRVRPAIAAPEAQPLPADGRPPGFNGAVGTIELRVRAAPTAVGVGDPITLTIELAGDAPIESLPPPLLDAQRDLLASFRVPSEALAGSVQGDCKRFTQTIRPNAPSVSVIPPIEYPYFDPVAEQYRVARSEPIPISVAAVERLESGELAASTPQSGEPESADLRVRDVLRGLVTSERELLAAHTEVTIPALLTATAAPAVLYAGCWAFVALRGGDSHARRRRQRAYHVATARLRDAAALPPAQRPAAIAVALARCVADRTGEPAARCAGRGALEILETRGVGRELLAAWAELVAECEQAAYAGSPQADGTLVERARECVRQLEREGL
ncbi:MAG: BatD family protein [Phycisphaerae bacterium]